MEVNGAYQEIFKLHELLNENNIPHSIEQAEDGWRIRYPTYGQCICRVIEYTGSQGASIDRLEIMGLLNKEERKFDRVVGHLTAENVFQRIRKDYERRKWRK